MVDLSANFNWTNARPVLGSALAHSRLPKPLRAIEAAEAVAGIKVLFKPTGPQAAAWWGVSPAYVYLAGTILSDEHLVGLVQTGALSLADAAARVRESRLPTPKQAALAEAWAHASDAELAELGHAFGVNTVWDRVISPNL